MDPQPPADLNNTPPQEQESVVSIAEKKEEALKKEKSFKLKVKLVILAMIALLAGVIFIVFFYSVYQENKPRYEAVDVPKDEEEDPIIEPKNELAFYKSDLFKLALKYPSEATLIEKELEGENPQKLEIAYTPKLVDSNALPSEENVLEGMIFRVTLLDIQNRTLDEITSIKRTSYIEKCPNTANITNPVGISVDGIEGRSFMVYNCNADYKVIYIPRFGIYYEIMGLYDGGVGIRQRYEKANESILASVDFYLSDEEIVVDEPFKTYLSPKFGFSFKQPSFDEKCCDIAEPAVNQTYEKLIVYGEIDKVSVPNKTSILGVFGRKWDKSKNPDDFGTFLQKQKDILVNDFKVVTGNNPNTSEEEVTVGESGKKGYLLKGYSWKGYQYIFIDYNGLNAIVFVIDNQTGDDFMQKVNGILDSFKFF